MLINEITDKYFSKGTRGYSILLNYYRKYSDLFQKTLHNNFNDFLNQILLNVSSINFSSEIKNKEAYIIGTLKIQCRVQLDKALKQKNRIKIVDLEDKEYEESGSPMENIPQENNSPEITLEANEIFSAIQQFKGTINPSELEILNNLIDEIPRMEMAENLQINMNTLDTKIRRIRIKFTTFLKESGHHFKIFEKYEK